MTGVDLRRAAGCAAAALVAVVIVLLGPAARAEPTARVEGVVTVAGARSTIRLEGLPHGVYVATVCGNQARRGSADCDLAGARGIEVPASGAASVVMAPDPPVACPCVVRLEAAGGGGVVSVPIDLPGRPPRPDGTALGDPMVDAARRQVSVRASVEDDRGGLARVLGAFGGPAERTLVVRLRNLSGSPLEGVGVSASVGRSSSPGRPIPPAVVGDLAPGQEAELRLPFTVDAPSGGRYEVIAQVTGLVAPLEARVETSTWPWGLPMLVGVALVTTAAVAHRRRSPGGRAARSTRDPREGERSVNSEQLRDAARSQCRSDHLASAGPSERKGL